MWILWILGCFMFYHCFYFTEVEGENSNITSYIFGISCYGSKFLDGIPVLYVGKTWTLYVFGNNMRSTSEIGFTYEDNCNYPIPTKLKLSSSSGGMVSFTPLSKHAWSTTPVKYYACLKDMHLGETAWRHQGTGKHVSIYVAESMYSPWMYAVIIIVAFLISSLMSGLNLGLMSLDKSELQLLRKAGTPKERKYAGKIIPVRRNGNYLVCSIVITATLCNTVSTVAIDEFFSNIITVIITTIIIVLLCEIIPQSICSAYPLQIGAQTIYITKTFMILTFPVSYPLSKILNCIVGKELAKSYNKERLLELLKKTHLPKHEEKIICGTLDFSNKKVEEVMTVLDDIFKLPITAVLNFETIAAILASGYSRIPIYVGDESNIQYVLLTKDLALLDPEEKVPVIVLVQKSKSVCHYIPKGTSLNIVLRQFKDSRHHMIFVTDYENVLDKKKECVIGLVTFEDIIEEIFQMEILDETDTIFDNKGKKRISFTQKTDLITLLLKPPKVNTPSENVKLSAYCFLSEIDEFSLRNFSPKVLISLLNMDIYYSTSGKKLPQDTIYVRGVPADYFVMILGGQMHVKIGSEDLVFEAGPFQYFGLEALKKGASFTPDYTVTGVTKALYLKISTTLYSAALLATRFERFKEYPTISRKSEVYKYFTMIIESDTMSNSSD